MIRYLIYIEICLFCFTSIYAQGIFGTQHDFKNVSGKNWNIPDEACTVCHTSDESIGGTSVPLWNVKNDLQNFIPYGNLNGNSDIIESDIGSKLCLSCHDGTIAEDNLGILPNKNRESQQLKINHIVSGEHPVSIVYQSDNTENKTGLFNHVNTMSGLGNTINEDLLFEEKMECASCHDVHNLVGSTGLLKIKNTKSELCLTCHNK